MYAGTARVTYRHIEKMSSEPAMQAFSYKGKHDASVHKYESTDRTV